ncbi:hypothetical protein [Aurantimonas sp. HBX-1]|uniref:hypothetical protein n=1 Tax=Aurantimonas sp. HBX-1 TaxID=2906072 RepID=UPI001F352F35|nr:hypothetical protein [Aurantimonas sp. HBX-1]UIJ72297.1 hypothetical protein LXB15_01100 [Aurantimonas sp. HBX-1]
MRVSLAIITGVAAALVSLPATAQVGSISGSGSGSSSGGVGSSGAAGGVGSSSVGGSSVGGGSSIGGSGSPTGGVGSTVTEPILPDAGIGLGGGSDSNAARATEGDSSINSLNVDGLARSGTGGSAVTTLGNDDDDDGFRSTAGSGSPQAYRIPVPTVDVDLGAIRRGLAAGPSATPKPNGD